MRSLFRQWSCATCVDEITSTGLCTNSTFKNALEQERIYKSKSHTLQVCDDCVSVSMFAPQNTVTLVSALQPSSRTSDHPRTCCTARLMLLNVSNRRRLLGLFTHCYPVIVRALFADHIATPVKSALTPFCPLYLEGIKPTPTTKVLTTVHVGAAPVAVAAPGARRSRVVDIAEIGRFFKEDQARGVGFCATLPSSLFSHHQFAKFAVHRVCVVHLKRKNGLFGSSKYELGSLFFW